MRQFPDHIEHIVDENRCRNRIDRYLERNPSSSEQLYKQLVADNYQSQIMRVRKIQLLADQEEWSSLCMLITQWIRSYLAKRFIGGNFVDDEAVATCRADALDSITTGYFPFDVEFDSWAHMVIKNVCNRYLQKEFRKQSLLNRNALEYDAYSGWRETLLTEDDVDEAALFEVRHDLHRAVANMKTARRRRIVEMHYFSGYTLEEVAAEFNSSRNAVYKLHYDALKELRHSWQDAA